MPGILAAIKAVALVWGVRVSRGRVAVWAATIGAWAVLGSNPAVAFQPDFTWRDTATVAVSPGLYNFSAGANWVGGVVPSQFDTAIFGATNTPAISVNPTGLGPYVQVDGFTFLAGAPAYTFSVTNQNFLQFYGAGIVNGGSLTVTTTGSQTQFYNASSAGSATFINNSFSTLGFYGSSTAGSANITNNSGGRTYFGFSSTAGNATITNNSGGQVQFFDNSTGGNARFINNLGGTIDFSSTTGPFGPLGVPDLTAGSLAGAGNFYLGNRTLSVGGNNLDTTVSGVISDCGPTGTDCNSFSTGGSLTKIGTGTMTLTGANTYTGDTVVNGGTLLVSGSGSIKSPAGTIYLSKFLGANSTLTVDGAGASVTAGSIYVGLLGPGVLNVTNGATVNGGDIFLAQSSDGNGTLNVTGAGSILNARSISFSVRDSAITIGPGATINLTTFYSSLANRVLTYNLSPAGSGIINVGSSGAFLAGDLKFTGINGAATTYTLFHSTGGFNGTDQTSFSNIDYGILRNPNLRIVGDDLLLSVDASSLAAILQPGVTGTPKQIADAIDVAINAGVTLPPGFNGVFNLSGDALVAALKQLSGQSAAGAQQTSADASNSLMGAMFDPFASGRPGGTPAPGFASEDKDDAMAYAPKRKFTKRERDARYAVTGRNNIYDPRWSVWGSAYGSTTATSGNVSQGTNDVTSRAFGFVTGADYNLTRNTTVGFALGGGGSNYGVAGGLGTGRAEMFQLGLFAKHMMGAAYISGGVGYTFQNVTTDRTVTIAGTDQLRATFNANTFSGRVEGGYRFATPVVGVTPYAALQVTNISLPSYGEVAISGNNTFALNYNAQSATIVRTELGARFDKSYALDTAMLTLRGRAAWAHDEGNNRNVSAVFGSLPGSNFTLNGAVPSKDLALVSAGADLAMLNNVTLSGMFEGQFSDTTTGFGGKGTVRYVW